MVLKHFSEAYASGIERYFVSAHLALCYDSASWPLADANRQPRGRFLTVSTIVSKEREDSQA